MDFRINSSSDGGLAEDEGGDLINQVWRERQGWVAVCREVICSVGRLHGFQDVIHVRGKVQLCLPVSAGQPFRVIWSDLQVALALKNQDWHSKTSDQFRRVQGEFAYDESLNSWPKQGHQDGIQLSNVYAVPCFERSKCRQGFRQDWRIGGICVKLTANDLTQWTAWCGDQH